MAKFRGYIGFVEPKEIKTDVWEEQATEKPYKGDVLRDMGQFQVTDQVIDDVTIANEISIVADSYANEHCHYMRYVKFRGARWKIKKIEVRYPRLIITVGGLYNGKTPS